MYVSACKVAVCVNMIYWYYTATLSKVGTEVTYEKRFMFYMENMKKHMQQKGYIGNFTVVSIE